MMEETSKRAKLRQNLDNLVDKRTSHLKDAESLRKQIENAKAELHKDEVQALDAVCKKKGITYDEICDFLTEIDISLADAAAIISRHTKAIRVRTDNISEERADNDE